MKLYAGTLALAVCAAMAVSLMGCGSKQKTSSAAPSPDAKVALAASKTGRSAEQLLSDLRSAYVSIKTLKADGINTTLTRADGKPLGPAQRAHITMLYRSPDKLMIDTGAGKMVTDGKAIWSYNASAKQYIRRPVTRDDVKSIVFSRAGLTMLGLLRGIKYTNLIESPKLLPDSRVGGKDVYVVSMRLKSGIACPKGTAGTETLWIGKKDWGLYRSEVTISFKPKPVKGTKTPNLVENVITSEVSDLQLNPKLPDSAFAFKPPAGAKLVQQVQPADLSGKPAIDFSFKWIDGATRKLSSFAGKKIILDFWAMPMSEQHLPVLQSLSKSLPSDTQLVAVNLNMDLADVHKYMKQKGFTFPFVPADATIAKVASQGYGLRVLPSVFFIDRNGTIQAELIGQADRKQIEAKLKTLK